VVAASNKSGLIAVVPAYAASASAQIVVLSAMATQTEVLAGDDPDRYARRQKLQELFRHVTQHPQVSPSA
jgi:hypothetical protein